MTLFSDRGTPKSYRHMHGYSGHTFKFTKEDGSFKYVQIHLRTDQGVENLTNDEAAKVGMQDADSSTKDLFDAIKRGDYPSWTVYVQVLDPKDAEKFRWNIFDLTKVWPQKDIPLRQVGRMTLNRNVSTTPHVLFIDSILTLCSPRTTLPKSSRLPSPPRILFLVLRLPPTLSCKHVYSLTQTLSDTASVSITSRFPSTRLSMRTTRTSAMASWP